MFNTSFLALESWYFVNKWLPFSVGSKPNGLDNLSTLIWLYLISVTLQWEHMAFRSALHLFQSLWPSSLAVPKSSQLLLPLFQWFPSKYHRVCLFRDPSWPLFRENQEPSSHWKFPLYYMVVPFIFASCFGSPGQFSAVRFLRTASHVILCSARTQQWCIADTCSRTHYFYSPFLEVFRKTDLSVLMIILILVFF